VERTELWQKTPSSCPPSYTNPTWTCMRSKFVFLFCLCTLLHLFHSPMSWGKPRAKHCAHWVVFLNNERC
jgi:hypothetical protein